MNSVLQYTPRAKIDITKIVDNYIKNTGFQAGWLKNQDRFTQGPRWSLTSCGKDCFISPACDLCPARAEYLLATREGKDIGKVAALPENLFIPKGWKPGKNCFVSPEGDPFHGNINPEFTYRALAIMDEYRIHNYLFTTKREENMVKVLKEIVPGLSNVVAGVSVESQEYAYRSEALLQIPEGFKTVIFAAPLITYVSFSIEVWERADWLIISPERGGAGRIPRPHEEEWLLDLCHAARKHRVPVYLDENHSVKKVWERKGRFKEIPPFLCS